MGRVARGAENVQLYLAFKRSTTPIHGKGCTWPKMCNFTSRSSVRPRQSMGRVARGADELPFYDAFARSTAPIHGITVAFPTEASVLAPALERIFKLKIEISRV